MVFSRMPFVVGFGILAAGSTIPQVDLPFQGRWYGARWQTLRETGDLPSVFYRALGKDGLCPVPNKIHSAKKHSTKTALPSVFSALGKDVFCRVPFFGTRQNASLPTAFFLALGKDVFCWVPCFGTRQRGILSCAFFFALGKSFFQSNFWGPKWIQMKDFSTTKLYNFSRSTKFILVISSFDKATITLFIKSTSLLYLSY